MSHSIVFACLDFASSCFDVELSQPRNYTLAAIEFMADGGVSATTLTLDALRYLTARVKHCLPQDGLPQIKVSKIYFMR